GTPHGSVTVSSATDPSVALHAGNQARFCRRAASAGLYALSLHDALPISTGGAGELELLVGAVAGLPLGDEVLDRDGRAVLPHALRVVLHGDDLRILVGDLRGEHRVRVELDRAVLGGCVAAGPHRFEDVGEVPQRAVGVVVVPGVRQLGHGQAQRAAVLDLVALCPLPAGV